MRHTFATWAIEDGAHLWHLGTIMGTSVTQLEDTCARWLKRTDEQLRARSMPTTRRRDLVTSSRSTRSVAGRVGLPL